MSDKVLKLLYRRHGCTGVRLGWCRQFSFHAVERRKRERALALETDGLDKRNWTWPASDAMMFVWRVLLEILTRVSNLSEIEAKLSNVVVEENLGGAEYEKLVNGRWAVVTVI